MGQSPPSNTYHTSPEGLPFFQGKADFGLVHPSVRVWCSRPGKVATPGDVLLSVRAPVGPTNVADQLCCIGRGLAAIRSRPSYLDDNFLLYLLRANANRLSRVGVGSTFDAIGRTTLASLCVPLPPLPEQRRIAAMLTQQMAAVDRARAAVQAQLEAAKALPGAYLREVFPKPEEPLPEGWRWVRLGEVCILNPRRPSLERAAAAPTTFLPMPAIAEKGRGIIAAETRPYGAVARGYTYFADGDVLFAKITPCMQNGKHAIARDLQDGIGFGSTEFHVLRPSAILTSEWLLSFLLQPWVLHEAATRFTGAVGQQRVPADFLVELVLPLPPLPEQRRIAAMLTEQMAGADRLVHAIDEGSAALDCLPSTLLAQALAGGL